MVDITRWRRLFPILLGDAECPECGGVLERDYIYDVRVNTHWRGTEADVCANDDCDFARYVNLHPEP